MRRQEINNTLYHHQHGFRHYNFSCGTQFILLIQDLTSNYDKDIQTDLHNIYDLYILYYLLLIISMSYIIRIYDFC